MKKQIFLVLTVIALLAVVVGCKQGSEGNNDLVLVIYQGIEENYDHDEDATTPMITMTMRFTFKKDGEGLNYLVIA